MKKLSEIKNIKYIITEGIALLLGILTFVFLFIPAFFEDGQPDLSIFQIMLGNNRIAFSGLLLFGIILIILGIVTTAALIVLLILDKSNSMITTILGVASIALMLTGIAICSCAIFVSGLDKLNSSLGFTQGQWGIKAGNILVPVFGLLSIAASYPAAMIILHEKDLADKKKLEEAQKVE